jgi:hypothetical protein
MNCSEALGVAAIAHAGSMLMSIAMRGGAVPANETMPVILPASGEGSPAVVGRLPGPSTVPVRTALSVLQPASRTLQQSSRPEASRKAEVFGVVRMQIVPLRNCYSAAMTACVNCFVPAVPPVSPVSVVPSA